MTAIKVNGDLLLVTSNKPQITSHQVNGEARDRSEGELRSKRSSPGGQVTSHKPTKVYVAGHNGMVGSAIMKQLLAKGDVELITRTHAELDLTNQAAVNQFFEENEIDQVYLAAAKVGGIHANNEYPAEFIYQNLMIEANIIHAAHVNGVQQLLFLGSSCIYPKLAAQPMTEASLLTDTLESTNEPYAIAKIAGIKLCESYNRQYGRDYRSVMPTNLYGENDNFHPENSHVIPALMRRFHLAKLAQDGDIDALQTYEQRNGQIPDKDLSNLMLERVNGPPGEPLLLRNSPSDLLLVISNNSQSPNQKVNAEGGTSTQVTSQKVNCEAREAPLGDQPQVTVTIWGSGKPMREFLYVDDMAEASIHVMNLDKETYQAHTQVMLSHINVGTGIDCTIREMAETMAEVVGFEGELAFDATKPDGTPRKLLDVSRLEKLGWQASTQLKEGLEVTYQWFLDNQDKFRK